MVIGSSKSWAQSLSYKVPTALLRVVAGFTITTLSLCLLIILLGLFNATGITIIITFFGWLIFKLLKIVIFILGLLLKLVIFIAKAIGNLFRWIF